MKFERVGYERYYETMAFHAVPEDHRYSDANVQRQVYFNSPWSISEVDADDRAEDADGDAAAQQEGRPVADDGEARERRRVERLEDDPVADHGLDGVGHHREEPGHEVRTEVGVAHGGERAAGGAHLRRS